MALKRAVWPRYPNVITWRSLTWAEHKRLSALAIPAVARYLETYQLCVKDGPSLSEVPFGIAYWIGRQELEGSPFSGEYRALKGALDSSRQWFADDYLNAAQAVIAWTFRYSPEEIERWDADKLFRRLAQAEFVFNRPLEPADPNAKPLTEEEKRKQRPMTARKQEQLDRLQKVMERRRQSQ